MHYITAIFSIMIKQGLLYRFLLICAIHLMVNFTISTFSIMLSNKPVMVVLHFADVLISYRLYAIEVEKIAINIRGYIQTHCINKYYRLDFKSKNKVNINNLMNQMNKCTSHVTVFIMHQVFSIIDLIKNSLTCTCIFVNSGQSYFIIVIVMCTIIYVILSKDLIKKNKQDLYEYNKQQGKFNSMLNFNLQRLGDVEPNVVLSKIEDRQYQRMMLNFDNEYIQLCFGIFNKILLSLIIIYTNDIVILMSYIAQYVNNVRQVMRLTNTIEQSNNDVNILKDMFKDTTEQKHLPQYKYPNKIIITNVNIKTDDKTIISTSKPIIINKGARILIEGPSGKGKTTFINAFIGKIDGVTFKSKAPGNYINDRVELIQDMREKFRECTIRNIFNDESDDDLINRCLDIAHIRKDIDAELTLSGGEKQRLCIAYTIYKLITKKASLLTLDELESGLDENTRDIILNNIFVEFPNVTIIVISHIQFNVKWDKRLYIDNQTIY